MPRKSNASKGLPVRGAQTTVKFLDSTLQRLDAIRDKEGYSRTALLEIGALHVIGLDPVDRAILAKIYRNPAQSEQPVASPHPGKENN